MSTNSVRILATGIAALALVSAMPAAGAVLDALYISNVAAVGSLIQMESEHVGWGIIAPIGCGGDNSDHVVRVTLKNPIPGDVVIADGGRGVHILTFENPSQFVIVGATNTCNFGLWLHGYIVTGAVAYQVDMACIVGDVAPSCVGAVATGCSEVDRFGLIAPAELSGACTLS